MSERVCDKQTPCNPSHPSHPQPTVAFIPQATPMVPTILGVACSAPNHNVANYPHQEIDG